MHQTKQTKLAEAHAKLQPHVQAHENAKAKRAETDAAVHAAAAKEQAAAQAAGKPSVSAGQTAPTAKPKAAPKPGTKSKGPPQPPDPHFTGDVTGADGKVYHFVDGKMVAGQQSSPPPKLADDANPFPTGSPKAEAHDQAKKWEFYADQGISFDPAHATTLAFQGLADPDKKAVLHSLGVDTGDTSKTPEQHLEQHYKDLASHRSDPLTKGEHAATAYLQAHNLNIFQVADERGPIDPVHASYTDSQLHKDLAAQIAHTYPGITPEQVRTAAIRLAQAEGAKLYPPGFHRPAAEAFPNHLLPDAARPQLSLDEANAAKQYAGAGYAKLNGMLYEKGAVTPGSPQEKLHKDLNRAIEKTSPLPQPIPVMRGLNLGVKSLSDYIDHLRGGATTGTPVGLAGYQSTSTAATQAFDGNVKLHILAKQGLDLKPYSESAEERELLLAHNSSFRVHSMEQDGAGNWKIHLEQLLPHEADALEAAPQPGKITTQQQASPAPTPVLTPAPPKAPDPSTLAEIKSFTDAHAAGSLSSHDLDFKSHMYISHLNPDEKISLAHHYGLNPATATTAALAKHITQAAEAAKPLAPPPSSAPQPKAPSPSMMARSRR